MTPIELLTRILHKMNCEETITTNEILSAQGMGAMKYLLRDWTSMNGWTNAEKSNFRYMPEFIQEIETFSHRKHIQFASLQQDIREAILTSFYTPQPVIDAIAGSLKHIENYSAPFTHILEPAAGSGRFLPVLRETFPQAQTLAIEKNVLSAELAKQMAASMPSVKVLNNVFENIPYDTKYDLIVTNIPFAEIKVFDRNAPAPVAAHINTLHGFYFAKAIELLNPGGTLCFITTTGIMDSDRHKSLREMLVAQADLISAVRLPDHVFKSETTRVSTDVILLHKPERKKRKLTAKDKLFIESVQTDIFNPVAVNPYYVTLPENVLGKLEMGNQYSNTSGSTVLSDQPLDELSKSLAALLDTNILTYFQTQENKYQKAVRKTQPQQAMLFPGEPAMPVIDSVRLQDDERTGNIIYRQDFGFFRVGYQVDRYSPEYRVTPVKAEEVIHGPYSNKAALLSYLVSLRQVTQKILKLKSNGADWQYLEPIQKELHLHYDSFCKQAGEPLSVFLNKSKVEDVDLNVLASLEVERDGRWAKADIFNESFIEKQTFQTDNLAEAVIHCYNHYGCVDMGQIAGILQRPVDELKRESLQSGVLRYDPTIKDGFCLPHLFRSGYVAEKIKALNLLLSGDKPDFLSHDVINDHILELEKIKPEYMTVDMIQPQIGEPMFQIELYQAFFARYLDIPLDKITIMQSESLYKVMFSDKGTANSATAKLGVKRKGKEKFLGVDMIEALLMNKQMYFTYNAGTVDEPDIRTDHYANEQFARKREEVYSRWMEFVSIDEFKQQIEKTYNQISSFVPAEPDGSLIQYDELTKVGITPRPYQLSAIAAILDRNGTLVDAPTGAGKTLIQLMGAIKLKRAGIVRKPLIAGIKSNIDEIYQTAKTIYPEARILYADAKSYAKANRHKFFLKIANNDWDLILMSHSQFDMIPLNRKAECAVLQERLQSLRANIALLKHVEESKLEEHLTKRQLKGFIRRAQGIEARLHQLSSKTDDLNIDIVKMGVDHIMMDEAHLFKNLEYTTIHRNVAGLNPTGSNRAAKLEVHLTAIRNAYYNGEDKGFTPLTATPLLNNMSEMYTWYRLLYKNWLKQHNMLNFDGWAQSFIKMSSELELTLNNSYAYRTRCREFIKLDTLMKGYYNFAYVVSPDLVGQHVQKPRAHSHHINIKRTEEQKQYLFDLIDFTGKGNRLMIQRDPEREHAGGAEMLLAGSYSNMASIDMRFIDQKIYADFCEKNENTKVNTCCDMVHRIYEAEKEHKGAQAIFCDYGVPGGKGFNLYQNIKDILINRYHIPAQEIAFVHDYDGDANRARLMASVNRGDIRVVLGSTEKLGTGVNMQKRLKANHNLDIPWRPADFDQRKGRVERPGNMFEDVDIYYYTTEETLDAFRLEILKHKQKMINQVRYAGYNVKGNTLIDDYSDGNDISYNEMVAQVTGNQTVKDLAVTQKEYDRTRAEYQSFLGDKNRLHSTIQDYEYKIINYDRQLERLKKVQEVIDAKYDPAGDITYRLPNGQQLAIKEFGEYVLTGLQRQIFSDNEVLATFSDAFAVVFNRGFFAFDRSIHVRIQDAENNEVSSITYNKGKIAEKAQTIGENPLKALGNVAVAIDYFQKQKNDKLPSLERARKEFENYSAERLENLRKTVLELHDKVVKLKTQVQKEKLSIINENDRIRFQDMVRKDQTFTQAQQEKSDPGPHIEKHVLNF